MRRVLIILSCLLALWLAGFIGFVIWQQQARVEKPGQKTDGILVLTGGSNRTHTGLMLLAAGQADHLMISGVMPGLTLDELITAYDFPPVIAAILRDHCCVTLGEQASDTLGNAIEAAPWIRQKNMKTIRLVTSVYHIPRALLMLREHAFDQPVTWVLHPVRPANGSLRSLNHWQVMAGEYLKLSVALLIPLQTDK